MVFRQAPPGMNMAAQIQSVLAMGYQPTEDEVPGAPPSAHCQLSDLPSAMGAWQLLLL